MRKFIQGLIRAYQKTLSPDQGWLSRFFYQPTCKFYPTCSEYMYQAVDRYGAARGVWLGIKRLARCHPWSHGGVDNVP